MIGWAWIVGVAAAAPWIERAAPLTFARFVVEDDHKGVIGVSSPALRRQVSAYLRDRGLDIRGDENAVFGIDKSEAARFALGAVIDEVYHRTGPSYRELSIRFRWEVLDLRTEAVVYAGSTVGHTAGGPDRYRRELTGDVDDCIEDGLGRLLNRELFQEALTRQFDPAPAETELPDTITLAACEASRTLPQDFDDLLAGVVTLTGPDGGVGTGIIVSPDGFVVTAAHVIEGGVVTARLRAGVEVPFDVLRTVPEHDVALLRIPGSKLACVPLADATPLGQDVWAVGTPLSTDLELSIAKGIVSGRRTLEGRPFVQTDAAISPGYSGGPLVSPDGRAVGVINSKIVGAGTEGVGFAVPSAEARAQLGIAFAAETADALPEAVTALPARPSLPTLEDVDDPLFRDTMTAAQREPLARRSRGQITGGIVLVVAGVAASAASTAVWASDEGKTQGQFAGLRAADATGWLVALSGTALAIRGGVRLAQLPDE